MEDKTTNKEALERLVTTISKEELDREPGLRVEQIDQALEEGRKLRDRAESAVVPSVRNLSQMFFK